MLAIIESFNPLLEKYARRIKFDEIHTDLVIKLIEFINRMTIHDNEEMKKDKYIISYISKSILYKYIELSKKHSEINNRTIAFNEDFHDFYEIDVTDKIILDKLLNELTEKQKYIIQKLYIEGYSAAELAKELNISKQAVNKTKKVSLMKIRKYI